MAKYLSCLDKIHLDPTFENKRHIIYMPGMKRVKYHQNEGKYIRTRNTEYIKRKNDYRKRSNRNGIGGSHPAWAILIQKCQILDFQSQKNIAQQNHWIASVVEENAQHELEKFWRHIREDKYM